MTVASSTTGRVPAPLNVTLARVAQGDQQAFRDLHRACRSRLLDVILRIQPDRAVAEEVLQEVLISIWRHAADYDASRAQPMTWMVAMARHRAIDSLRRQRRDPQFVSVVLDEQGDEVPALSNVTCESPGPEERRASLDRRRQLDRVLPLLSARQQLCLSMVYTQDLTQSEVSHRTSLPLGTVKALVRRALIELRLRLRPDLRGTSPGQPP